MKKNMFEIILLLIQLFMFYIFPLFAGPTDAIGMVILILLATFILSLLMGSFSKCKYKLFYCLMVSILFIPSVFIYYNESALVHALWYLIISLVGLIIGFIINKIGKLK